MRDQGEPADDPLWSDGEMMFRVAGAGGQPDRLVKVRRPFALVGRTAGADVLIGDRGVSARHAYLHLDPRGVYAVDLATRTGTRVNGVGRSVGWVRPGDWLEVGGFRIDLVRVRLGGREVDPPPCDDDLLADAGRPGLAGVALEPRRSSQSPWVLGSELVFLGWSASCGIQVKDPSVARTHCAVVRAANGAFLVDLCGRETWVEDRPVQGASAFRDGDLITLGATQFTARVEPPSASRRAPTGLALRAEPTPPPGLEPGGFDLATLPPPTLLDPGMVPPEAQTALLTWLVGTIRGGQNEALRRQGEFQEAVTHALRQIRQENSALLNAQLERIESIDRELAEIRSEIDRRNAHPPARPLPDVLPLRIARTTRPNDPPADPKTSTTWLLQRVGQLEAENRSAWKDLLGRLNPPKPSA